MSLRGGMIFGGIWSFASVGWIAGLALIITWIRSGWDHALFWFGLVLLSGAGLFAIALVFALVCEALNLTTKRSRRDSLNYFSWAFAYNLVVGSLALLISITFGNLDAKTEMNPNRSEHGEGAKASPATS